MNTASEIVSAFRLAGSLKVKAMVAATLLVSLFSAAKAQTIETFSTWDGTTGFGYLGPSVFQSFGQTFKAPAPNAKLSSFTFALQLTSGDPGLLVTPYLYEWDTNRITGSALYAGSATPVAFTSGVFEQYTFTLPIPVILDPAKQYVIFLSTLDIPGNGNASLGIGGLTATIPYPDGSLVAATAGTFADLFNAGVFTSNGFNLAFSIIFAAPPPPLATNILQNSAPYNTSPLSTFVVNGPSFTGSVTENNTIAGLIFINDGSLEVNNLLLVTSGNFAVPTGTGTVFGGSLITPLDFSKLGSGTLIVNSEITTGRNLDVTEGNLVVGGPFIVGGNANLAGTAIINGQLTTAGDTIISGFAAVNGTLFSGGSTAISGRAAVNGVLASPFVQVLSGGKLQGNSLVIGNVLNDGTVAPGNSIGTLTIDGNFTQSRPGALEIEIDSAGRFDQFIVSSTSRLGGTLDVRSLGGADLEYGNAFSFLSAGRIIGKFSDIQMPDSDVLRGRFINSGSTGILLVAPTSYTLVAETQNDLNVAAALDNWIGIETGNKGEVTLALDLLTTKQYANAFAAIQPRFYDGALKTSTELGQTHGQLLLQQFSSRRLGRDFAQQGAAPLPATSAKSVQAAAKEPALTQPTNEGNWVGWTQASGLFSSGGLSLIPGEDFESGTFVVGGDYRITDNLSVGLFGSYQEGWADYASNGDMDVQSTRFGAYVNYDQAGFYVDLAIGGGQTGFDIKRPIMFDTLNRSATSEPDGYEFFTLLGTGYDFKFGPWTVGPQISIQYNKLKFGSFDESGAGSLNLHVRDAETESLRSYIGGRVAYTFEVNERFAIIPELRAFWQHEYLGDRDIHSRLDGGAGPGFLFEVSDENPDTAFVGAGLGVQFGARFYANVYYNATFGQNDGANHTVSMSASWRF